MSTVTERPPVCLGVAAGRATALEERESQILVEFMVSSAWEKDKNKVGLTLILILFLQSEE